eukprot:gnl/TRDRNA2_/TRDRNA2_174729_c2_seq3.p1 gnl/TRDRNA2_/TRDRNA2_174729_c2~~gnl/TRDRNA2_/TRDRNA2_174729_c2_seq3.p1  ORF type:complete len:567 (+),score=136.79 gnl/TRDRNA2_/TRDRNA2_174729_c2_seq3:69-1769(+)
MARRAESKSKVGAARKKAAEEKEALLCKKAEDEAKRKAEEVLKAEEARKKAEAARKKAEDEEGARRRWEEAKKAVEEKAKAETARIYLPLESCLNKPKLARRVVEEATRAARRKVEEAATRATEEKHKREAALKTAAMCAAEHMARLEEWVAHSLAEAKAAVGAARKKASEEREAFLRKKIENEAKRLAEEIAKAEAARKKTEDEEVARRRREEAAKEAAKERAAKAEAARRKAQEEAARRAANTTASSSSAGTSLPPNRQGSKRPADVDLSSSLEAAQQPSQRRRRVSLLQTTQRWAMPSTTARRHLEPASLPEAAKSSDSICQNDAAEMCSICCDDVEPGKAVRLACQHGWYCRDCITRHTEARLELGTARVPCPECSIPLAEHDLRKLLPPEVMERLLSRSVEQAVLAAGDVRSCPTPDCPMRVALEEGELPRMKCPICKKTCCLICGKQPYHRGLTCEEAADENEKLFRKWMEASGTKQCPSCGMAVSKQNLEKQATQYAECHKMQCRNCETRFCFKCCAVLTESYTCGCSADAHQFIDPTTGMVYKHLDKRRKISRNANAR